MKSIKFSHFLSGKPFYSKVIIMDLSQLITMLSSVLLFDNNKTLHEKICYALLLILITKLVSSDRETLVQNVIKFFERVQGRYIREGRVIRCCSLVIDETNVMTGKETGPFMAIMYDIEDRVDRKLGIWGNLHIEQIDISKGSASKVQLPQAIQHYLPVGDDFPTISLKCSAESKVEDVDQQTKHSITQYTLKIMAFNAEDIKNYVEHCKEKYRRVTSTNLKQLHVFIKERITYSNTIAESHYWDIIPFTSTKTFDNQFFDTKDELKRILDRFAYEKCEYKRLGMPYTLTLLLHGAPGTGKTSLIKAIANYTQRHIIIIPTQNVVTIEDLKTLFYDDCIRGCYVPSDKRLYVFEEIDCGAWSDMVMDRNLKITLQSQKKKEEQMFMKALANNIDIPSEVNNENGANVKMKINEKKSHITLGEFLELLDGIVETDGRMIIFTTNHVENLDPAILRPGRVDHILEIKRLTRKDVRCMYRYWFGSDLPSAVVETMLPDRTFAQAEMGKIFLTRDIPYIHAVLCGNAEVY